MKADMTGAATVMAAIHGIEALKLPINVIAITPLCENMPSGNSYRPGDILISMNGKSVEIDNTDAEGRLILADALSYADTLSPIAIVDVATLTGAIDVALGHLYIGLFTLHSSSLQRFISVGNETGDRMWPMPLNNGYMELLKSYVADMKNSGGRSGGACSAAIFLKQFVKTPAWVHLDIAGVMHDKALKLMSGSPTRALIEFTKQLSLENK